MSDTKKEVTIYDVLDFVQDPDLDPDHHRRIVEALNRRVKAKRQEAKAGLRPGMRVTWFSTRSFRQVVGRIEKVNRVNVDVLEEGTGVKWRCSPGLLKLA